MELNFLLIMVLAVFAAVIAALAGFGIGSLITPALALTMPTKEAVALVTIPHLVATTLRFAMTWRDIDRTALKHFGLASAFGGLAGAALYAYTGDTSLTAIFGLLLIGGGISNLAGAARKIHWTKTGALGGGFASGFFGGLAGHQGGVRAIGLMSMGLSGRAFVATSTAVGVIIDVVRLPFYLTGRESFLPQNLTLLLVLTVGVSIGTIVGMKVLKRISPDKFIKIVALCIVLLGCSMVIRALV